MSVITPMACPRHLSLQEALRRDLDSQPRASEEAARDSKKPGRDDFLPDCVLDGQLRALH